jgi:hypothetical protein
MLGLMSGRRSADDELVNASFADMGVAIESLLKSENDEDDIDETSGFFLLLLFFVFFNFVLL